MHLAASKNHRKAAKKSPSLNPSQTVSENSSVSSLSDSHSVWSIFKTNKITICFEVNCLTSLCYFCSV